MIQFVGNISMKSINVTFYPHIVFTDVSSGANTSYLPAAAMKTYPMSDTGFASHQPESKVRQMYDFFLRISLPSAYKANFVTGLKKY